MDSKAELGRATFQSHCSVDATKGTHGSLTTERVSEHLQCEMENALPENILMLSSLIK